MRQPPNWRNLLLWKKRIVQNCYTLKEHTTYPREIVHTATSLYLNESLSMVLKEIKSSKLDSYVPMSTLRRKES